jgi:phosphoribosylamine--glycine ligase
MNILLIGSGGREHALAWKMAQNKDVRTIYVANGNAGTARETKCVNVSLSTNKEYLQFAKKNRIDLTIVGPEVPLVEGVVDLFQKNKLLIFGPSKNAAKLEGSKIFAKNFMKRYHVETAAYATFNNFNKAVHYLNKCDYPIVIKASGLASGKGVEICENMVQARECLKRFMVDKIFKASGIEVVIEEFLKGVEASIICVTDGKTIKPLISAQDHKTIYENNKGPNTGGMGAICPNQHVNKQVMSDFTKHIMLPTLNGIKKTKMNYHGFIFFGVMITSRGCKCLEYNVRMGDPECQSIIPLMDFDLVNLFLATINNQLNKFPISWKIGVAINVVLASKGYPSKFNIGYEISIKDSPLIFYANAKLKHNKVITDGGRVMSVVATGRNCRLARQTVYSNVKKVKFTGKYFRKDIGLS